MKRLSITFKQLVWSLGLRVLVAIGGIAAMRLSFEILSEEDFYVFSLGLFYVALANACCAPINRKFWLHYEPDSSINAVIGGTIISFLVIVGAFATAYVSGLVLKLWWAIAVGLAFTIYASSRLLERYSYGAFVVQDRMMTGLMVSLIYVVAEVAILLAMLAFESTSLAIRVLLPALFFLASACGLRVLLYGGYVTMPAVRSKLEKALSTSRKTMCSPTASWVLFINIVMTFASMGDRLLVGYRCDTSTDTSCPGANHFLLLLAYAVALQSLLNVFVDWARPRVYYNDRPGAGGFQAALGVIAAMLACGALVIIASPILEFVHILPPDFGLLLWASLVVRAICLSVVVVTQIDLINRGLLKEAAIVWVALAMVLISVYLFGVSFDLEQIQLAITPAFILAAALSLKGLRRRFRLYADDQA